jgi:hypothetical protein
MQVSGNIGSSFINAQVTRSTVDSAQSQQPNSSSRFSLDAERRWAASTPWANLPEFGSIAPFINFKGSDAMQQTAPKARPSEPKYEFNLIPRECRTGTHVDLAGAAAENAGASPAASFALGWGAKAEATEICAILSHLGGAFETGPDNLYDPANYGAGGACTDPGPFGGQSAGTLGGFCSDPTANGRGASSANSYIDPDTGERITNEGGLTIAGDPAGMNAKYIGEADDPGFTNDDHSSTDSGTSVYAGEADDPNFVTEKQADDKPEGAGPKDDNMPSDDGIGPNDPHAHDAYMPADDGSGGVGPRLITGVYAGAASLSVLALSRMQLM